MSESLCDFCGLSLPQEAWSYPSQNFSTQIVDSTDHVVVLDSTGVWLACDGCYAAIEQDNWDALGNRMVECYLADHPEDKHKALIEDHLLTVAFLVHDAFRKNRKGDPFRQHAPR